MRLTAQSSLHCSAAAAHKGFIRLPACRAGLVYMARAKHPWLLTTKHGTTTWTACQHPGTLPAMLATCSGQGGGSRLGIAAYGLPLQLQWFSARRFW